MTCGCVPGDVSIDMLSLPADQFKGYAAKIAGVADGREAISLRCEAPAMPGNLPVSRLCSLFTLYVWRCSWLYWQVILPLRCYA